MSEDAKLTGPFRLKCVSCNARLDFNQIFFDDSNLCTKCKEKIADARSSDNEADGENEK